MKNELLYQAGKTGAITINGKELAISAFRLRELVELNKYAQEHTQLETRLYNIFLHLRGNKDYTLDNLYDMPISEPDSIILELDRIDKEISHQLYPPQPETES